jgi:hypothetical protein
MSGALDQLLNTIIFEMLQMMALFQYADFREQNVLLQKWSARRRQKQAAGR